MMMMTTMMTTTNRPSALARPGAGLSLESRGGAVAGAKMMPLPRERTPKAAFR